MSIDQIAQILVIYPGPWGELKRSRRASRRLRCASGRAARRAQVAGRLTALGVWSAGRVGTAPLRLGAWGRRETLKCLSVSASVSASTFWKIMTKSGFETLRHRLARALCARHARGLSYTRERERAHQAIHSSVSVSHDVVFLRYFRDLTPRHWARHPRHFSVSAKCGASGGRSA